MTDDLQLGCDIFLCRYHYTHCTKDGASSAPSFSRGRREPQRMSVRQKAKPVSASGKRSCRNEKSGEIPVFVPCVEDDRLSELRPTCFPAMIYDFDSWKVATIYLNNYSFRGKIASFVDVPLSFQRNLCVTGTACMSTSLLKIC